jgi:hypothetical protein
MNNKETPINPIIDKEVQKYLKAKKEMKDVLGKNIEPYSKEEELLSLISIKNSDKFRWLMKSMALHTFFIFATIAACSFLVLPWSIDVIPRIAISVVLGATLAWVFNFSAKNKIKTIMYRYIELMEEYARDYQKQQTQTN